MKNDQWFRKGDKVMECMTDAEVAAALPNAILGPDAPTKPGVVYCVEEFMEHPCGNVLTLVGVDEGLPWHERWIVAMYFRRVSEIQLCVRAARKARATTEESSGVQQEEEVQP